MRTVSSGFAGRRSTWPRHSVRTVSPSLRSSNEYSVPSLQWALGKSTAQTPPGRYCIGQVLSPVRSTRHSPHRVSYLKEILTVIVSHMVRVSNIILPHLITKFFSPLRSPTSPHQSLPSFSHVASPIFPPPFIPPRRTFSPLPAHRTGLPFVSPVPPLAEPASHGTALRGRGVEVPDNPRDAVSLSP